MLLFIKPTEKIINRYSGSANLYVGIVCVEHFWQVYNENK
jgi:hypothetical protein